jgi:hypothetical protein
MSMTEPALAIRSASDGVTWKEGEIDLSKGDRLAVWVAGLPENADRHNTRAWFGGELAEVVWVERGKPETARQVNVCVPEIGGQSAAQLWLEAGGGRSQPVSVRVLR